MKLDEQGIAATEILRGKSMSEIVRHRSEEVMIEFTDGTRLFIDRTADGLDLSITDGTARCSDTDPE